MIPYFFTNLKTKEILAKYFLKSYHRDMKNYAGCDEYSFKTE